MPAAKKAKRKSRPPARLKEFLCEDNKDKGTPHGARLAYQGSRLLWSYYEHGPRRSRRTPKISEKLKRYMDDKGGMVKEHNGGQVSNQMKNEPQITITSGHQLLGSKYSEPKVVLKALPKSLLQKGVRTYPVCKRETRVTLKRLGNSEGNKKMNRVYSSKLHKQKASLTKTVSAQSSKSSHAALPKKELKVELEDIYSSTGRPLQNRRGKRKRVAVTHQLEPKEKLSRMSPRASGSQTTPRASDLKAKLEKIKERGDSKFDPDVMKKLFNFGAKVKEVLTLNKETINKLTKVNDRVQSLTHMVSEGLEDIDESNSNNILKWLEKEEHHRKEHREKVLESMRVSHSTNIALYSDMLSVLQSVTASV